MWHEMERRYKINATAELQGTENEEAAPYVSFPSLEKLSFIRHGFSTKLGGVSEGAYASLNLGFHRGDNENAVLENYRRICRSMQIPAEHLVFTDQTHDAVIKRVTKADCGKGIFVNKDYSGIDGLITNCSQVALVVFAADCVPIFFADPVSESIGVAHAGWRGTLEGIASSMVERMKSEFGINTRNLRAVIGPSICKDCYEVGSEVAEQFVHRYKKLSEHAVFKSKQGKEKFLLDLWKMNRQILLSSGVPENNIVISGVCTCCRKDLFYSHRVMGTARGSMAGFLMKK